MDAKRPIFVSVETTSFSGATLLAFLLNTHPQIATIGEMDGLIDSDDPEEYQCSCGQKIKNCEFWCLVKQAMHKKGFDFDIAHFDMKFALGGSKFVHYLRIGSFRNNTLDTIRDRIFQTWPKEKRQLKARVARNEAFIRSVLEVTNRDVFIDTSKDRMRLRVLNQLSTLDVRVIHLVRDVRGVVASWLRRDRGDVSKAARQWSKRHNRLEKLSQAFPKDKYLQVRYEDLCQDVQGTLKQIFDFCDVDTEIKTEDFRGVSHHIVGNKMRLENLSEIRLDEQWRRMLTQDQLKKINQVAGSLCQRYGYN